MSAAAGAPGRGGEPSSGTDALPIVDAHQHFWNLEAFDTILEGFHRSVSDLTLADQRKLFHDSALRIYRLA